MTGKEALKELLNNPIFIARTNGKTHYNKCVLAINRDLEKLEKLEQENKNLKEDINILCDKKYKPTWRSLMDERNNLRNLYLEKCFKLDEYKKAFEILKDKTGLEIKKVNNLGRTLHKLYYGDDESTLEKEEAELLEELIKNEN